MRLLMTFVVLMAVVGIFAGCEKAAPPPPPPQQQAPPPEPTPQDYLSKELQPAFAPIKAPLTGAGGVTAEQRDAAVNAISPLKAKMQATENGRQALEMFQRDVEDTMKQGRKVERWGVVKGCCMVIKVLQPGSDRFKKLEERADIMLARPIPAVKGFFGVGSDMYVFIDLTDPKTSVTKQFKVREGEEFGDAYRLVRIVGDKMGVELLYLPVQESSVIWGPNKKNGAAEDQAKESMS